MVNWIQQALFLGTLIVATWIIFKRFKFIKRNILLGKKGIDKDKIGGWKTTLLLAFGQKKMFDKPLVGIMHLIIYIGFVLINIEVLEIVIDGITGSHRVFSSYLGSFYPFLINFFEILALGVLVSCVLFLTRRNILNISRFKKPEMKGWPTKDANIILIWEVALMLALFTMNATDSILQNRFAESSYVASHYPRVGTFAISQFFIPIFSGLDTSALIIVERVAWWVHIIGILSFAVYITFSKHLHIFLAFPNSYFAKSSSVGKMQNMDAVTKEVKIMLGMQQDDGQTPQEVETFGAKDIFDLSWKNLMDAYSCTECGRCTAVCPANITGKKLSPRKIMMDTRDRVEEVGKKIDQKKEGYKEENILYGNYISKEELMACTTCNACVEACPVSIDPLDIILQLRRYIAMEESGTPPAWNAMFTNIENNAAPWAFAPTERFKWSEDLSQDN